MKRIIQEHPQGCGIACIAMLTGLTYAEAFSFMKVNGIIVHRHTTQTKHIVKALRLADYKCRDRLKPLYGKDFRDIQTDAVLKVKNGSKYGWHWVVWDVRKQRILDPDPNCPIGTELLYEVDSYLGVVR